MEEHPPATPLTDCSEAQPGIVKMVKGNQVSHPRLLFPDVFPILNGSYGLAFRAASSLRQVRPRLPWVVRTAKHWDFTQNNYVINHNNNFKLRSI